MDNYLRICLFEYPTGTKGVEYKLYTKVRETSKTTITNLSAKEARRVICNNSILSIEVKVIGYQIITTYFI